MAGRAIWPTFIEIVLTRPGTIRHRSFGYQQAWCEPVRIPDVEEHSLGNLTSHFPLGQIHHKEGLLAFDFLRI